MTSTYRWVILALGLIAFMQTHLHRLAYAPLIPGVAADLGLTYAAAGTIQAAYFWTYTLVQLPVGIAVDRWGARRVMLACMALLTVGAVAFASARSYPGAIVARMVVGLGAAAVWVPSLRLVSEWFPPAERGRATGLIGSGGALGGTLGLIVVPWLASGWGWRWAYGVTALPAAVTAVLIAALLRAPSAAPAAPHSSPAGVRHAGKVREVLAIRPLWPLTLTLLFAFGGFFSFLTFLPSFLITRMGYSPSGAGFVAGLITAGTVVSWPLVGALSDLLGRRKPFYVGSLIATVVIGLVFAFGVPHLPPAATAVIALLAGLLVGGMLVPFAMLTEMVPSALAGTAAGIVNGACFVGVMVLPIVLGRMVDVTGSFTAAFVVAAGVQGIALICALVVPETGRPRGAARDTLG